MCMFRVCIFVEGITAWLETFSNDDRKRATTFDSMLEIMRRFSGATVCLTSLRKRICLGAINLLLGLNIRFSNVSSKNYRSRSSKSYQRFGETVSFINRNLFFVNWGRRRRGGVSFGWADERG